MMIHGYLYAWPVKTGSHAGITSTPSSRIASGDRRLFLTKGAEVIYHMSQNLRLTLNRRRASLPLSMARNLPEPQKNKLLSRTNKQSEKVAWLNLQYKPVLPLLPLPHPPGHLLSGKVARLNPYRKTKQGVPVDQTLLPDIDEHGENRVTTLKSPMIGRTSTSAELSVFSAPIAREPFDLLYASSMLGGGTLRSMS